MKKLKLLLVSFTVLTAAVADAQIYQYVDDRGKKVFVDSLSKVPHEYREQLTSRDELKTELSDDQKRDASYKLRQLKLVQDKNRIKDQLDKWITPYQFYNNRIIVPVKVVYGARSKNLSLVMDTGASSTVVHRSAVTSLNPGLQAGGSARVADGSVVQTQSIKFNRVEIGPFNINNVQTMVIDYQGGSRQSQGLLGMDFLLHAKYEIDRVNQRIIWEPELFVQYQERLQQLEELEQQLKEEKAAQQAAN